MKKKEVLNFKKDKPPSFNPDNLIITNKPPSAGILLDQYR